ncbi:MAG: glycerol-3-phosphate dehydrogenase [Sphingomonadaceae bacterium]|nr:glycerol-3-phosphate dehydrogenase [Sphingomonadaceae bacterium]
MTHDLLVIGGGINGAAIARDAAGRGWKVILVEKDDLASHTSSASTKLIHGGLRYLEYRAFGLVRKALKEREVMLRAAPHLVRPMRFVMPHRRQVRPYWMIRAGLLFYDLMAGRTSLQRTRKLGKANPRYKSPLADPQTKGCVYSDCWVDDSRLVIANARDAADKGAEIVTRDGLENARRTGDGWQATLASGRTIEARAIVNAAGPWVCEVLGERLGTGSKAGVRLVRGGHIIVPRLYVGDHAYLLQQPDRRIVFAMPYEREYTLIGTTDEPVDHPTHSAIDEREIDYLCRSANGYFAIQIGPADVVSTYAGVRSLYDDGAPESAEVTRDYVLELDEAGAPLLSVFGGKITTARALAEEAADKLGAAAGLGGSAWTKGAAFPGGDLGKEFDAFAEDVRARWPFLDFDEAERMARAYGSRIDRVLGDARTAADLGEDFGGGLSERELGYLVCEEWARDAEDVIWRRTKTGLRTSAEQDARIAAWLAERAA